MDTAAHSKPPASYPADPKPQLYRVNDVALILNLGRTVIFELIRTGRLRSVKEGRARLVPASAIREYVALLEREAEAA